MLKNNARGVEKGYPLRIESETIEVIPSPFNAESTTKILHRIQWLTLKAAAADLGITTIDAFESAEAAAVSEDGLRAVHNILFEVNITPMPSLLCDHGARMFAVWSGSRD